MNKLLLLFIFIFFSHPCAYSANLIVDQELSAELKLLLNCLPQDVKDEELNEIIDNFNNSFQWISTKNSKIFTKTEIYKFVITQNTPNSKLLSIEEIATELEELISKRNRFCRFDQWVLYSMKTDLEKLKKSKKKQYRKKFIEYSSSWIYLYKNSLKTGDSATKSLYFNFLKTFMAKSNIYKLSNDKNEKIFLTLNSSQPEKPEVDKKEVLDKIFEEEIKTDN